MHLIVILKLVLAFSVVVKSYIHTYIGDKNDLNMGAGFSFKTLWFYNKAVSIEYEKNKKLCNKMQWFNLWLFTVVIILSFFE